MVRFKPPTYVDRYPNVSEVVRLTRECLYRGDDYEDIFLVLISQMGYEIAERVLDEAEQLPDFHT